nr:NADH deshydrogenase subunit 6 [Illiberis ulmivora]
MFLSMMMILFSICMYNLSHPLSMGLFILIQTFLICIISGMMLKTYWFSYILFLIFLGGLLILFIYVSSIASNEMFFPSNKMKMFLFIFIINSLIFSFTFSNIKWMNFSFFSEMESYSNYFILFNNENKMNLSKLYNSQTFFLMLMLIIYLFITLVSVIKITNIFYGPLRSNF